MVNRTSNAIQLADYDTLNQDKEETKALRTAYLGDGNGNFEVEANGSSNDHYGKMYIRFLEDGAYGQPVEAYVDSNATFTYKDNLPLHVYKNRPSEQWFIDSVDVIRANKANLNTLMMNPLSPRNQLLWLRQMQDGKGFAPATSSNSLLTISIQPFTFVYDGSIYNGGKNNTVDLTAYMPTAGNERLVVIGERANDRTIQIVQGSTRTITSAKYALSDIATLIAQFDDYVIPLQAVKLADGATTVLEKDLHQDLRQFFNVQQPRGFPNPVTRHRLVAAGYKETVAGSVTVNAGATVEVEAGGSLIVIPDTRSGTGGTPVIRPYATKTSNYTITSADSRIRVDASGGAITITLPLAASVDGYQFDIKAIDVSGGNVTIATTSSELIDGTTTAILTAQYENLTIASYGTGWDIL